MSLDSNGRSLTRTSMVLTVKKSFSANPGGFPMRRSEKVRPAQGNSDNLKSSPTETGLPAASETRFSISGLYLLTLTNMGIRSNVKTMTRSKPPPIIAPHFSAFFMVSLLNSVNKAQDALRTNQVNHLSASIPKGSIC